MSGLYSLKDDNGIIELCNANIGQLALNDIMNYVSIMSQDTYLFEGSIYNNINLFNDTITLDEVRNICKRLGLDNVIMTFSDGYETIVSRMQKKLSRGQIQRIGLARTLLQKKNIILLDEPTSALDLELSKIVMEEIKSFSKDRTIILISHKLNQPQDFDRIMVLKDGEVAGFDTNDNLRMSCEAYNTLLNEGMTME
jgi:ABC-type multidrug transport system fused ATPase/permease subunit